MSDETLLTVDTAVELIRSQFGIPITKSRIYKDTATGRAPRPDATFGNRYLWKPEAMLAYGRSLIRPHQPEATP
jgi:hypothetical protein